jgi:hypothetical protein
LHIFNPPVTEPFSTVIFFFAFLTPSPASLISFHTLPPSFSCFGILSARGTFSFTLFTINTVREEIQEEINERNDRNLKETRERGVREFLKNRKPNTAGVYKKL